MLEYSEFLILLFFVVVLGTVIFAFTMGVLIRSSLGSSQPKRERVVKPKNNPSKKNTKKSKDDRCQLPGGYVGMLKEVKPKERPYPEVCPHAKPVGGCPCFLECIGMEKQKK